MAVPYSFGNFNNQFTLAAGQDLSTNNYTALYSLIGTIDGSLNTSSFKLPDLRGASNPVAACEWFEKAAQGNIPAAQPFIGACLASGIGHAADPDVRQDLAAARYWYQQAGQHRMVVTQYRLGVMPGQGEGGDANPGLALSWREHAASERYAPVYLPVAILYGNSAPDPAAGALTPASLATMYMWSLAAEATTSNPADIAEIEDIEQLLQQVMPPQWKPELDRRVAEHLAELTVN